jgi:predicted nucleic acid-binding Zn ribbon protein
MDSFILILILSVAGLILLWLGYSLFFRIGRREGEGKRSRGHYQKTASVPNGSGGGAIGAAGSPRTCPICSSPLEYGEKVKSAAFPGIPNQGRTMHISGCVYCMDGSRQRTCPVCGTALRVDEYLIARMFDQPGRSHVHVLGCTQCRGLR